MHNPPPPNTRAALLLTCFVSLQACDTRGTTPGFVGAPSSGGGATAINTGFAGPFPHPDAGQEPEWNPQPADPDDGPADAGRVFEVTALSPARDAVGVPRDTSLELTFSKELDDRFMPIVELFEPEGRLPARRAIVTVEGDTLIATVEPSLDPGVVYRVVVKDTVGASDGERLRPADLFPDWSFTTAPIEGSLRLDGPLDAVSYDPVQERVWGFDREARALSRIDLIERVEQPRTDLLYIPGDLCVSPDGETVYVVNQGSSLVTALEADSGLVLRQIPWPAPVEVGDAFHYHIRCSEDRLFVVDAADQPGLWSFDLTQEPPIVQDHSAALSGLGDLAASPDGSTLYAWWQVTEDERSQIAVGQLDPMTMQPLQHTEIGPWPNGAEALRAPILVDAEGARVITQTRVLDAADLSITLFTFDATLKAADFARNRAVTNDDVYSLDRFRPQALPVVPAASHRFFDDEGRLHFVVEEPAPMLITQTFERAPEAEAPAQDDDEPAEEPAPQDDDDEPAEQPAQDDADEPTEPAESDDEPTATP